MLDSRNFDVYLNTDNSEQVLAEKYHLPPALSMDLDEASEPYGVEEKSITSEPAISEIGLSLPKGLLVPTASPCLQ